MYNHPHLLDVSEYAQHRADARGVFLKVFSEWVNLKPLQSRFYAVLRRPLFDGYTRVELESIEISGLNGRLASIFTDPILSAKAFDTLVNDCRETLGDEITASESVGPGVCYAVVFRDRVRSGAGLRVCVLDAHPTKLNYCLVTD